ncbi:hypothetical protein HUG17_0678 [Dermatophagoides farinae]|uniref:Uncharacterized protein n=2 Tax=Dermatophagoides farinae TaxID=6954 RepID=A0A9D4P8P7_DERFA|nr:hypothetical protein HUG17_0678 [Dermatophagoides farinae]
MLQLTVDNCLSRVACLKIDATNINRAMDLAILAAIEMNRQQFIDLSIEVDVNNFHHEQCIYQCTAYTTSSSHNGQHCQRIQFPLTIELDQYNGLDNVTISLGHLRLIGCIQNQSS